MMPPSTGPATPAMTQDGAHIGLVAAALARRDHVGDHRLRKRHDAAAADALQRASGDQPRHVGRQRRQPPSPR